MKAIVYTHYGPPDVLQFTEVEKPLPQDHEVLIKVQAAWGRKLADLIATYASASRDSNSNSTIAAVGEKPDSLPMQLFGLERVLVRADFPPSAPSLNPEVAVKFFSLAANASPITGTFFDNAPTADPQTQSRGIFYIIDNTNHQFAAGMSLNVAALTAEPVRSGVLVPRDAVLRAQGENWVYVRIAPDKFSRREIKIDQVTDKGLFVVEDLKPGSTVVTTAAQELLSEELKEQ